MAPLSISQARHRLTQLAGQLQREQETVEVTNRGRPVLAILPWALYEAMEETIEILSDEDLMKRLRESLRQLKRGRLIPWNKVKKKLALE